MSWFMVLKRKTTERFCRVEADDIVRAQIEALTDESLEWRMLQPPTVEWEAREVQGPLGDDIAVDCGYGCGWTWPYGFVPEAGCLVHDEEEEQ